MVSNQQLSKQPEKFQNFKITPAILKSSILSHIATSHSAYAATETKLYAAKIDGLLPPNFL